MTREKIYLKFTDYEFIQDKNLYKVNSDTSILGASLDNLYKKEVSRNIAKKLGKCEQKLTELTAKELKELFDNINI